MSDDRWAELRERIRTDRREYDQQAAEHGEMGKDHWEREERCYGRVEQCDDLLAAMDRLEAER